MADEIYLAAASIFLYSIIAALSGYYFWHLTQAHRKRRLGVPAEVGRFDPPKILFFQVLFVSAILDLPMYFGCIAMGGPTDCEWDGVSYPIFWCLHLIALIGYTFSVVTPPVLWIDIMYNKDGLLWNSRFPVDRTKRCFQAAVVAFSALMFVSIILVTLYFNVNDPEQFSSSNLLNATGVFLEPVSILFITVLCLSSGIQLQLYVRKVKLDSAKEMKFLFHLNVTMSIIVLTYLTRGLFVLRLFYAMPEGYENATRCSYFQWLMYTRWLPYIFCSLCLINEMRVSVGGSAADGQRGAGGGESRRALQSNTSSFFSVRDSFAAKTFTRIGLDNDHDLDMGEDGGVRAVSRSLLGSVHEDDSMLSSQFSVVVLDGIGDDHSLHSHHFIEHRRSYSSGQQPQSVSSSSQSQAPSYSMDYHNSHKSMSNTDDDNAPIFSFDQALSYDQHPDFRQQQGDIAATGRYRYPVERGAGGGTTGMVDELLLSHAYDSGCGNVAIVNPIVSFSGKEEEEENISYRGTMH